jgi:hypothetical protein
MLPNMTSDRILAVRVFKGELEKLSLKKEQSGVDILIADYLKMRIRDMEKKGHAPS